mgnify:CR=1 FL=1
MMLTCCGELIHQSVTCLQLSRVSLRRRRGSIDNYCQHQPARSRLKPLTDDEQLVSTPTCHEPAAVVNNNNNNNITAHAIQPISFVQRASLLTSRTCACCLACWRVRASGPGAWTDGPI